MAAIQVSHGDFRVAGDSPRTPRGGVSMCPSLASPTYRGGSVGSPMSESIPISVDVFPVNNLKGDSVSSNVSLQEIIAYGGIQQPVVSGIRSSERIHAQPNADATQVERAMAMACCYDSPSGTKQCPRVSLLDLSDLDIVKRANRLGVSLVKN